MHEDVAATGDRDCQETIAGNDRLHQLHIQTPASLTSAREIYLNIIIRLYFTKKFLIKAVVDPKGLNISHKLSVWETFFSGNKIRSKVIEDRP